jgi:hypothetical protein
MKVLETIVGMIALGCFMTSIWKIIERAEYNSTDMFIIGCMVAIFAAGFKGVNDSHARDRLKILEKN